MGMRGTPDVGTRAGSGSVFRCSARYGESGRTRRPSAVTRTTAWGTSIWHAVSPPTRATGSAVLDPARHPGGDDDRVVRGRERRCVGQVGARQLLSGHPRPDGGGEDIDPLAAPGTAHDLRPEQQPRSALADQLDVDGCGAGVVAGAGRGLDQLAAEVEAAVLGLGGAQPGPGDLE